MSCGVKLDSRNSGWLHWACSESPITDPPRGLRKNGLLEGIQPHPMGWRRSGGRLTLPWFLGAALLGFVLWSQWDCGMLMDVPSLLAAGPHCQGPPGGYKSQKIKSFPAKSTGRANWGPTVLEGQLGWWQCSFLREVDRIPPWEEKLRHRVG